VGALALDLDQFCTCGIRIEDTIRYLGHRLLDKVMGLVKFGRFLTNSSRIWSTLQFEPVLGLRLSDMSAKKAVMFSMIIE
jgi:hypothetical protein